ncbi:MAG: phosphopantetheine-binding protein [Oscillospiraceae bacterium]|nr:phosphopantetheine-binding protein [Oscillospiraceae bacterium]
MDETPRLLDILKDINEDIDFASQTALVDDGLLDSFDITSIIAALDQEFGVRIKTADIEPDNFNSVQAIMGLVARCREQQ